MLLDYGTVINPLPIKLSIGSIKKPKLIEVSDITFEKYNVFEYFLEITPEKYYTIIKKDSGKKYWDSLSDKEKENLTLYNLILEKEDLQEIFLEMFNFFFEETVVFRDGLFVLLRNESDLENLIAEDVRGIIHEKIFLEVLEIIQQICGRYEPDTDTGEIKFKNKIARDLYNKMLKAQKKQKKEKKGDIDLTLPNIISSVASQHPSLNYDNIWNITIYQLIDTFNRMRVNMVHEIERTRVSVWGDEKKKFDPALWYKNQYDKS